MKKIFCVVFLVIATVIYSQIKLYDTGELIGEATDRNGIIAELRKKGEILTFMYRDMKYKDFERYKIFIFEESDLDTIYNLFLTDEKQKGDSKTVELETNGLLIFDYKKSLGIKYIEVFHQSKGVREILPSMTTRQIRKLFGKL